jgi:hypothetical protein
LIILGLLPGAGLAGDHDLTPRQIYELTSPAVVMIIGYSNSGEQKKGRESFFAFLKIIGLFVSYISYAAS